VKKIRLNFGIIPCKCIRDFYTTSLSYILFSSRNRVAVGVDPGARLYEYSEDDGTLLDYKQYGIR
jgi:hypothetical protein